MTQAAMATPFVYFLARELHESGRASVAAGQTLAHAVQSPQVRPFVEWLDLPSHVIAGRIVTAAGLLERYEIAHIVNPQPVDDRAIESLATMIHDSERKAIDNDLVLVRLNRPWVPFADLPEPAQQGRRRQAAYLFSRFEFVPII